MRTLLQVVQHCHNMNVLHRDVRHMYQSISSLWCGPALQQHNTGDDADATDSVDSGVCILRTCACPARHLVYTFSPTQHHHTMDARRRGS